MVEQLYIRSSRYSPLQLQDDIQNMPSRWQDYIQNMQWLENFHQFTAVKNLSVCEELAPSIALTPQDSIFERAADVLPALENLFLGDALEIRLQRGLHDVHAPTVHVSIPTRPHNEPLRDAEEESEAHVPTPRRPLPDAQEQSTLHVPGPKRRALLVGISYEGSIDPVWVPLEPPHDDVENFRELLISVYSSIGFPLATNSYPRYLRVLARRYCRS